MCRSASPRSRTWSRSIGPAASGFAVTSAARSPFLPEVPTLKENGVELVADAWYGMWLPAGSPKEFAEQAGCGCHRGAGQARGEGKAAGDRIDPGRLDARRSHAGVGCQHRVLATDREGDRLQDHGLDRAVIASEAKQSISPRKERMDCFVALLPCANALRLSQAMTIKRGA